VHKLKSISNSLLGAMIMIAPPFGEIN